jgi:hypothetical protein
MFFKKLKEKREIKRLLKMVKRMDYSVVPLFKSVCFEDQIHSLQYMIISKLKERVLNLEHKLIEKRKTNSISNKKMIQNNHLEYLLHKLSKIHSQIKYFQVDFSEEEFKKICSLLNFIERDIKYV